MRLTGMRGAGVVGLVALSRQHLHALGMHGASGYSDICLINAICRIDMWLSCHIKILKVLVAGVVRHTLSKVRQCLKRHVAWPKRQMSPFQPHDRAAQDTLTLFMCTHAS